MKKFLTILFAAAAVACAPKTQDAPATQSETPTPTVVNHAEYKSPAQDVQQRVHDYLKECGTYFIATANGDQPHVRPFGALHLYEGKLYIMTGHVKRIAKQLALNPKFEICALKDNAWVRVFGTMVEDERVEAKKSFLDAAPHLRNQYNENDDNMAVYYIKDATATFSSFSGADETVKF